MPAIAASATSMQDHPSAPFIAADVGGETKAVTVARNQTATVNFAVVRGSQVTGNASSFAPTNVTVPLGSLVRWVTSTGPHTVTPDNPGQAGAWASANLSTSFEHTFNTAGTFDYHCQLHAGMVGKVTVNP